MNINNKNIDKEEQKNQIGILIKIELEKKIQFFEFFFNYFKLNKEFFSKALQNDIKILTPLLKENEDLLTTTEKQKLIFINDKSNSNYTSNSNIYLNQLQTLLKSLRKLNLELKMKNEKLENNTKEEIYDFNKSFKNPEFELVYNEYTDLIKQLEESTTFKEDSILDEELTKIKELKKDIKKIFDVNEKLRKEREALENRINSFYNLPPDITQIRILIEIKKEEYKSLCLKK